MTKKNNEKKPKKKLKKEYSTKEHAPAGKFLTAAKAVNRMNSVRLTETASTPVRLELLEEAAYLDEMLDRTSANALEAARKLQAFSDSLMSEYHVFDSLWYVSIVDVIKNVVELNARRERFLTFVELTFGEKARETCEELLHSWSDKQVNVSQKTKSKKKKET